MYLMSVKLQWSLIACYLKIRKQQGYIYAWRNELVSLFLQPPKIPQTFGASLFDFH